MARERRDLVASRLPDLPDAGYHSAKQKAASDAIMFFMRQTERNRRELLYIVCMGRTKWRQMAMKQWRGLAIDHDTLNQVYDYFVLQAGPNPGEQLTILANLKGM